MEIAAPCVVSLTWRLADAQGAEIDELSDPVEFFFGGDDLLAKVEEALRARRPASRRRCTSSPSMRSATTTRSSSSSSRARSSRKASSRPGCSSKGRRPAPSRPDMPDDAIYTVTEVYPDHVVLDGNHPLAGIALRLALVVRDVREATEEEIEAGSVGSPASASSPRLSPGPHLH